MQNAPSAANKGYKKFHFMAAETKIGGKEKTIDENQLLMLTAGDLATYFVRVYI